MQKIRKERKKTRVKGSKERNKRVDREGERGVNGSGGVFGSSWDNGLW